jgi:hypothetical protein
MSPAPYQSHELHSPERIWPEKNCYIDIWIEVLHSRGLDPLAMLAFTVAIDFEGDQWTFFKPPHEDLKALYGIDVQELYVWRPLLEHALEHLPAGKLISTEADAFWLPDTSGSDYRTKHTKTTIVLQSVDLAAQRLDYFHNGGCFSLQAEDFVRTFRLGAAPDPEFMPLFAELLRLDRLTRLDYPTLQSISRDQLRRHLAWRPRENPITRFRERLERDWPHLISQGMQAYHAWVFGTLRQLGSAAELSALYLRWLDRDGALQLAAAAAAFLNTANLCKSLVLKSARAVNAKRALDAGASFDELASSWHSASTSLHGVL